MQAFSLLQRLDQMRIKVNDFVLHELALNWDIASSEPAKESGDAEDRVGNAIATGRRAALQQCSTELRSIVRILGRTEKPEVDTRNTPEEKRDKCPHP